MNTQPRKLAIATGVALSIALLSGTATAAASQEVTDARQEAQISTTYTLSPYLRSNDLSVSVHEGTATLSGKVNEDVNKDLAEQIALGVKGIEDVDNKIEVQADYSPKARTDRGFGEVVDDASITTAIKSKLIWGKNTDGATTVNTLGGKVTLTGTADSAASKELAGRIALNTSGVTSVNNQLVVTAAKPSLVDKAKSTTATAGTQIADSWITTKVKTTYMYSSNVSATAIEVNTKAGVVSLSGKASNGAERALAIELADNIRGVKSVNAKALTI